MWDKALLAVEDRTQSASKHKSVQQMHIEFAYRTLKSVEDITSKGRNKPVGDNRTRLPQEGTIDTGQHILMRLARPGNGTCPNSG